MRSISLCLIATASFLVAADAQLLKSSVHKLRTGKAQLSDIAQDSLVRRTLKSSDPTHSPWEFQLLVSEWYLRAQMLATGSQFPIPAPGHPDLITAWDWLGSARQKSQSLEMNPTGPLYRGQDALRRMEATQKLSDSINTREIPSDAAKAMVWIGLEVAVRLQDGPKAAEALKPALQSKDLKARELSLALMASGYAGQWNAMSTFGDALGANPSVLPQLRALATYSPAMPDFGAVLELVREDLPSILETQVGQWQIHQMTYHFQKAECADPTFTQRAKEAYAQASTGPLVPPISRYGGVVHWMKPGSVAIPMSGPATKGRLRLRGQAVKAVDGLKLGLLETLDLVQNPANPRRWTGTQRTEQTVLEGQAPFSKTYTLILDVEAELEAHTR